MACPTGASDGAARRLAGDRVRRSDSRGSEMDSRPNPQAGLWFVQAVQSSVSVPTGECPQSVVILIPFSGIKMKRHQSGLPCKSPVPRWLREARRRHSYKIDAPWLTDLNARSHVRSDIFGSGETAGADEKTSIQARCRLHPTEPCGPDRPVRVENRYKSGGAWVYLSALDVHHSRVFGRCEACNGITAFDSLVEQVMTRPPYNDARRVFWIVDNCSVHRVQRAVERLRQRYPQASRRTSRPCSHSRQLAQPGGDLLFNRAEKGPHPE